jgi:hypothetical protein
VQRFIFLVSAQGDNQIADQIVSEVTLDVNRIGVSYFGSPKNPHLQQNDRRGFERVL